MRLLLVDLGAVWGGQEIYSRSIARAMVDRGWAVTSMSPHDRHAAGNIEFHRCSYSYSDFMETSKTVSSMAKKHDIVHFNGIRAIYLSAIMKRSKPFVGTKHSPYLSTEERSTKSRFAHAFGNLAFRNLDRLVSVSNKIQSELPSHIQKKSEVVLNGVEDTGENSTTVADSAPLTLCFVGRFVEAKGVWRLLEAVDIAHRGGVKIHLLLAGGGELESDLRAYVERRGLSDVVSFLGYVERPGEVFRRSHICVLPSLHEGLPLSLLEAMSARCALLGHNVPGVRDVIQHEINGLIADVPAEQLAYELKRIDADRPLLSRLRANSREHYENRWRLDRMVDETEAIYRRLINIDCAGKG